MSEKNIQNIENINCDYWKEPSSHAPLKGWEISNLNFENNQSESETVDNLLLHLQFVQSRGVIFSKILVKHNAELGIAAMRINQPLKDFVLDLLSSDKILYPNQQSDFQTIRLSLNEFVDSNCFFGKEKPVPRIEKKNNGNNSIYLQGGNTLYVSDQDLSELIFLFSMPRNRNIPFYEPKPTFKSEWTKVYPINLRPELVKTNYDGIASLNDVVHEVKNICAAVFNQTSDGIKIHEFKIWKI